MGSGKTTVAEALSLRLGLPVRDSDADMWRLWDRTGADIAERHGVPALHEIERGLLLGALADPTATIIAAAASTVDDEWCRAAMRRRAFVVVLAAPAAVLIERMTAGDHRRSVDPDDIAALADRRAGSFAAVADLELDARLPPAALAASIEAAVAEERPRPLT